MGIAADQTKVNSTDGAYIGTVAKDGAAAAAGLKKGDIIKKINDVTISSWSELQGTVASLNTGEKVNITYKRDGKEYTTSATLKAETGNLGDVLGAELENLDKKTAEKNEVEGGVVVKKIKPGGPFSKTRMQDGFIITSVNGVDITNTEELSRAIASLRSGSLNLEGFYDGYDGMYRYPVNLQLEDE